MKSVIWMGSARGDLPGIYVLHCFQKKSEQTSWRDIALAARRYKAILRGEA